MTRLMLCTAVAGMIFYWCTGVADGGDSNGMHPRNLYESNGQYVIVAWTTATEDANSKPSTQEARLPAETGVPIGTINRLERIPEYATIFRKYPNLTQRQRELDTKDPEIAFRFKGAPPTPLYQMFERWLGVGSLGIEHYELRKGGKPIRSPLGVLFLPPYNLPPSGVVRSYKQPKADLAKSLLFSIGGDFYSVYGDCQVAKHVPVKEMPDSLAALRYAGNPLYACSEGLPPCLQSCGVDSNGVLWVADGEGHIVLFRTGSSDFLQKCITVGKSQRVLIPRNNQSRSIFAFSSEKTVFQEYSVDAEGTAGIAADGLALPAETQYVLFSDASRVVFLTTDKVVVSKRDSSDKERMRSVALKLEKTEKVWEGLYLVKEEEIALLVGPTPQVLKDGSELFKLEETRKSWDSMKLIVVSVLPETE